MIEMSQIAFSGGCSTCSLKSSLAFDAGLSSVDQMFAAFGVQPAGNVAKPETSSLEEKPDSSLRQGPDEQSMVPPELVAMTEFLQVPKLQLASNLPFP